MTNEKRLELERRIVARYVQACLEAGARISVNDGEETVLRLSTSKAEILAAMFSTDEDYLTVYLDPTTTKATGVLRFVYGNEPGEVLADYHTVLEPIIGPAIEYAEKFA